MGLLVKEARDWACLEGESQVLMVADVWVVMMVQ